MSILKQVIKYTNACAIEATWVDEEETVIKSTAYSGDQMQLFRDDVTTYGGDITEYEALIAEVEAAYVPPPPAPVVIPAVVSMRQARLALLQQDLLGTVNAAIAQGNEADKITWEYATEVRRTDPLVANMALALNLSEQDLDNLFLLAATL